MHGLEFDVAHMLSGGLVLGSFLMLYQERMPALINALALQSALRHPERLAGVLAMSTYLPLADALGAESSPANRDIPIFMAHGTDDPVIPISRAQTSKAELLALGYSVEWHEYRMPHSVCMEEVADIAAWMRTALPPTR